MNLVYKENLFTSFGHLPVTENAKTGIFWELPKLAVFRELPNLAVPGQLWQFQELPNLAVPGQLWSCQTWQFQQLPNLAVQGVANFGSSGSCQSWLFGELYSLAKGFGPIFEGVWAGFREREGSIFSNHQHFAVSTGICGVACPLPTSRVDKPLIILIKSFLPLLIILVLLPSPPPPPPPPSFGAMVPAPCSATCTQHFQALVALEVYQLLLWALLCCS